LSGEESTPAGVKGQMLPGIAGICLLMVLLTIVNVYAGLRGIFGTGAAKYGVLTLSSLLAVGIYGLMGLKKWGWALVIAGCLLLAAGDLFLFTTMHQGSLLLNGLFMLVFFLYLARPETRARLW
jgi:hypothetical protein